MAQSEPTTPTEDLQQPPPARVDLTGSEPVSIRIVEAIAARVGADPTEVDVSLYEHVDPEALDRLYAHSRQWGAASWAIDLSVDGFEITVRSDGEVVVA